MAIHWGGTERFGFAFKVMRVQDLFESALSSQIRGTLISTET